MSCTLASGFTRDCSDSLGGIEEILISERDNVSSFTEASHEITAIIQTRFCPNTSWVNVRYCNGI